MKYLVYNKIFIYNLCIYYTINNLLYLVNFLNKSSYLCEERVVKFFLSFSDFN